MSSWAHYLGSDYMTNHGHGCQIMAWENALWQAFKKINDPEYVVGRDLIRFPWNQSRLVEYLYDAFLQLDSTSDFAYFRDILDPETPFSDDNPGGNPLTVARLLTLIGEDSFPVPPQIHEPLTAEYFWTIKRALDAMYMRKYRDGNWPSITEYRGFGDSLDAAIAAMEIVDVDHGDFWGHTASAFAAGPIEGYDQPYYGPSAYCVQIPIINFGTVLPSLYADAVIHSSRVQLAAPRIPTDVARTDYARSHAQDLLQFGYGDIAANGWADVPSTGIFPGDDPAGVVPELWHGWCIALPWTIAIDQRNTLEFFDPLD